jgi:hypothetical protein
VSRIPSVYRKSGDTPVRHIHNLRKIYIVNERQAGSARAALENLIRRRTREVPAVDGSW